jgi:hypothetical protein
MYAIFGGTGEMELRRQSCVRTVARSGATIANCTGIVVKFVQTHATVAWMSAITGVTAATHEGIKSRDEGGGMRDERG